MNASITVNSSRSTHNPEFQSAIITIVQIPVTVSATASPKYVNGSNRSHQLHRDTPRPPPSLARGYWLLGYCGGDSSQEAHPARIIASDPGHVPGARAGAAPGPISHRPPVQTMRSQCP